MVAGGGEAGVVETGQTGSQALALSLGDCQGPVRAPRAPSHGLGDSGGLIPPNPELLTRVTLSTAHMTSSFLPAASAS